MYTGEYTPWRRDAIFDKRAIDGDAFSSWDNCMAENYCKWPVIAAIIVGSLLLLSILWCIFSCMCCATRVCCCCTNCVRSCCSCCWCGGDSNKPSRDNSYIKYDDTTPIVASQPMPVPAPVYYAPPPAPVMPQQHIPQVGTFDSPRAPPPVPQEAGGAPFNPDSLPHMPAWSEAKTRYVHDEHATDNMEMETLPPAYPPDRHASPLLEKSRPSPQPSPAPVQPLLAQSPVPRVMSPGYEYHDVPSQQPAAPAWNHDPYYGAQGPSGYAGYADYAGTPARMPSPSNQHYAQPNTAPYPHSMAGGDDAYAIPTHNLELHSQGQFEYGVDGWRHSPVQQHQIPSPGFMGQSTYGEAQDLSSAAGAAGAAVAHSNAPGMLAPGSKPAPQGTQRQSAELGF